MFYSAQILSKKGPLATIWIAAHLDRRLKRQQVFETSISSSVDTIINPEAPLALRLSGQLLLGVVRIYSRQVNYVYEDCNSALSKLKQVTVTAAVDLPPEHRTAARETITLPDAAFDFELFPDEDLHEQQPSTSHGSLLTAAGGARDSIIMADDISALAGSQPSYMDDERFEVAHEDVSFMFMTPERARRESMMKSGSMLLGGLRSAASATPTSVKPLRDGRSAVPELDFEPEAVVEPPPMDMDMVATTPILELEPTFHDDVAGTSAGRGASDAQAAAEPAVAVAVQPAVHAAAPVARQRSARKRGIKIDVTADGAAATELNAQHIRDLLMDRSSLLRPPVSHQKRARLDSGAASEGGSMFATSCFLVVNQPLSDRLQSLYKRAMAQPETITAQPPAAEPAEPPALFAADDEGQAVHVPVAVVDGAQSPVASDMPVDADGADQMQVDTVAVTPDPVPLVAEAADRDLHAMDFAAADSAPFPDAAADFINAPDVPARSGDIGDDVEVEQLRGDGVSGSEMMSPRQPAESGMTATTVDAETIAMFKEIDGVNLEVETAIDARSGFTARTRVVLSRIQDIFQGRGNNAVTSNGKRKRVSVDPAASQPPEAVTFASFAPTRNRQDAARMFFEMLVLNSKGYIHMEQSDAYDDINIRPNCKLIPQPASARTMSEPSTSAVQAAA